MWTSPTDVLFFFSIGAGAIAILAVAAVAVISCAIDDGKTFYDQPIYSRYTYEQDRARANNH